MTQPAAQLLFGDVMHRRLFPVRYRFVYRVFSLLVDVERVGEAAAGSRWFSHNRFNLFSFYDVDHGPRTGEPLKPWLLDRLRQRGHHFDIGRVELQCFPRVLGHVFNPMSTWTCFNPVGEPVAVLCEVSNTFGESHGYLLHQDGAAMTWPIRDAHAKQFYVSPFIDMNADYHFRFSRHQGRHDIVIRESQNDALMLVAVQRGTERAFSDANLLRAAFAYPLLTLKVVILIHWHALKIWLGGGTYYPKPEPPREEIS